MIGSPFWNRMPVTGSQSHGLLPLFQGSRARRRWRRLETNGAAAKRSLINKAAATIIVSYQPPLPRSHRKKKWKRLRDGWILDPFTAIRLYLLPAREKKSRNSTVER